MASTKDIFEAKIFGAALFACGVFRGGLSWVAPTCTITEDVTMPANAISADVTMPGNSVTGDIGMGCGNQ